MDDAINATYYFLGVVFIVFSLSYVFLRKEKHMLVRLEKRAFYGVWLSFVGGLLSAGTLIINFDIVGGVQFILISWLFAIGLSLCSVFGAIIACEKNIAIGGWLATVPSLLFVTSFPLMYFFPSLFFPLKGALWQILFISAQPWLWPSISLIGGILLLTTRSLEVKEES